MHRINSKTKVIKYIHPSRGETYFAMELNKLNGETMYWFGHYVSMWYGKTEANRIAKAIQKNCVVID